MNHTLSEQIEVTQEIRRAIKVLTENGLLGTDNEKRLDSVLNDIGSTLAALNLTKHLPDEGRDNLTPAQKATIDECPYIDIYEIDDCPKCSGSGELQPDIQCKSCEGTGIKNFDPSESARREEYLDRLFSLSDKILVADGVEHEKEIENQVAAMSYDVIQSQSSELKEKGKRIAQLEDGLREAAGVLRMATLIDKSNTCEKAMVQAESLLNKTN